MKKVVQTGLGSIVAQLNTQSQIELAQSFANRAKNQREKIENTLKAQIEAVNKIAKEADRKADILEDFEKGQLEDALIKLMQTQGMKKLLDGICITLADGNSYSVGSVLASLANFASPEKEERRINTAGETTGFKYTLTDGVEVLTELSRIDSTDGNSIVFKESTENWNGVAAYKTIVIKITRKEIDNDGETVVVPSYEEQSISHWLFDLSVQLSACGDMNTDVDLNNDGKIGTDTTTTDTTTAGDGATL